MAKNSVTGKPKEEIEQMRQDYQKKMEDRLPGTPDFEDKFCLARIAKQPEDYDGPDRYCTSRNVRPAGSSWLCKHHGGATDAENQYDITQHDGSDSMKHGMFATSSNLIDDFDEKDRALYNWIMRTYPEAYDLDLESDPDTQYELHRLATETVRAERGRGHVISEGEVKEQEVRNEDGVVVLDEDGKIVTEKSQHYLADVLKDQDNKITRLKKELGITRKERLKRDQTDDAVDAIKDFAELGTKFLSRDDKDYDKDSDKPWEQDNDSTD